jgi:hypothetical protein
MPKKMHTSGLPRRRTKQGGVRVSGSMCGEVLRGQHQGQREDAGRGCYEAGRRRTRSRSGRDVWNVSIRVDLGRNMEGLLYEHMLVEAVTESGIRYGRWSGARYYRSSNLAKSL